jgi:hypothetical protein
MDQGAGLRDPQKLDQPRGPPFSLPQFGCPKGPSQRFPVRVRGFSGLILHAALDTIFHFNSINTVSLGQFVTSVRLHQTTSSHKSFGG